VVTRFQPLWYFLFVSTPNVDTLATFRASHFRSPNGQIDNMSQLTVDLGRCGISSHDFADERCLSSRPNEDSPSSRNLLGRLTSFHHQKRSVGMTYLLSVSHLRMLHNTFPLETIKHLLSQPHNIVIFLVPVKLLAHPHLFNYNRLPNARGSCLQILPFDAEEDVNDDQVVTCIAKICKQRSIDGFMSFDEDWPSRCRLAAIVKSVNSS
jgi:hypothetical protein